MKNLVVILIALFLVSCGTTKKLTTKTDTETKTETSTKTVTKEKVDTTVTIPSKKADFTAPIDSLMKGDTAKKSINGIEFKAWYDNRSRSVELQAVVEPVSVPIRIDRETTTESETKAVTEENTQSKSVEKEQPSLWDSISGWLFLILLLAVVLLIARFAP